MSEIRNRERASEHTGVLFCGSMKFLPEVCINRAKYIGCICANSITKKEWLRDGVTVMYGSATELWMAIGHDISEEKKFSYRNFAKESTGFDRSGDVTMAGIREIRTCFVC